ncbi:hypothetical protein MEI_00947 [Bartonella vinsonii subsp. arupensis Pm136co]|uniref:Integral membrane protein n=1 Tax=Bartonella vinsonii subsp. arupensis Pm136co TaxID=1094561 RepID=A0ABP2QSU9_BARVI|nr:hypothetical protein MEI_00947 [Bartonella vinsonii subsp. arupensis Pm136co]
MVVTRGMFLRAVVFCCIVGIFFGFSYKGAGGVVDMRELFLRVLVFSCFLGAVFVIGCVGVKSTAVTWGVFLKVLLFCLVVGIALVFAGVGVRRLGVSWAMFLMGGGFLALLELFLVWLTKRRQEGRQDGVVLRCLLILKWVVFCSIVGGFVFFMREGAEHMGVSWLWCSNDFGFYVLFGFTFPLIYEGARCVGVLWDWFLEKGFLLGSSR